MTHWHLGDGHGVEIISWLDDHSRYLLHITCHQVVTGPIVTVGDSYDNALAETVVGLYKNECVKIDGPFRTVDELELATLSWVHCFNENRLHSAIGDIPPIEFEALYYREINPRQQPLPGELALH